MKLKTILIPAVALFSICLVAAALLAVTNSVTAEKIEAIAAETEEDARREIFPDAASFGTPQTQDDVVYAEALDYKDRLIGYTFTSAAKGYGGDVTVMTGVLPDGTIAGVEILDVSDETPAGTIGVSTASKQVEGGIDALTGATYTSRGVAEAVNKALALFEDITKGGAQVG